MPRSVALYIAAVVAVCVSLAIVGCLDHGESSRVDRIDTLSSGPFLVERTMGGVTVYLTWPNTSRGIVPRISESWTEDVSQAWRFAAPDSAEAEASKREGARVVSAREVLK